MILPRLFDYLAIENPVDAVCARQLAGMYVSRLLARSAPCRFWFRVGCCLLELCLIAALLETSS
jgi:hypothetical protein